MRFSHRQSRALVPIAVLVLLAGSAFPQDRVWPAQDGLVPRFVTLPPAQPTDTLLAQSLALTGDALPTWHGWFSFDSVTYAFSMLGSEIVAGARTTNVDVILIPLRVSFADRTALDATRKVCGGTQSPLRLTERSPLFRNMSWAPGGTNVGTTQYVDAFQRANFWNRVQQAPYAKYHTIMKIAGVMPVQTIDVPADKGSARSGPCAPIGEVDFSFYDVQINSLITHLGIQPNTLPIFLAYNVFGTSNGCCILGYHGVRGATQIYGVAAYTDPGIFEAEGIQDIHALSHEIAEIYDNPYAGNNSPRWQSQFAPQYGCNYFLEVADPLVGSALAVTVGGMTYHPQELAFKSWFAKKVPSNAVNGWYSFGQTLPFPSPVC